jgi:hypothetical protein
MVRESKLESAEINAEKEMNTCLKISDTEW